MDFSDREGIQSHPTPRVNRYWRLEEIVKHYGRKGSLYIGLLKVGIIAVNVRDKYKISQVLEHF